MYIVNVLLGWRLAVSVDDYAEEVLNIKFIIMDGHIRPELTRICEISIVLLCMFEITCESNDIYNVLFIYGSV